MTSFITALFPDEDTVPTVLTNSPIPDLHQMFNLTAFPNDKLNCGHADNVEVTQLLSYDAGSCASSNNSSIITNDKITIGTLNVCSLKPKMNYPEFIELVKQYTIFCVLETKIDQFDIINCPGYKFFSKPRADKYKRKSGGIGFFVHESLVDNVDILDSDCEYIYWLKYTDKHQNNIVIGALYLPPEQSRFFNQDELFMLENDITSKCTQFEYVLITGDANAHTAVLADYDNYDDFLFSQLDVDEETLSPIRQVDELRKMGIPIDRKSKCSKINRNGRVLLDICKFNGIFIVNGRIGKYSDKFTFRDVSVIDYSICTPKLLQLVNDFEIIELDTLFSDGHCLLSMSIHACTSDERTRNTAHKSKSNSDRPPKWNDSESHNFVTNIDMSALTEINDLLDNTATERNKQFLDNITSKISNVFVESAKMSFSNNHRATSRLPDAQKHTPWFGLQCKKARTNYNKARKSYQLNKSVVNRHRLNIASRHYKQTMNTYIKKHKYCAEQKLRKLNSGKPKDYWKFLNSVNVKRTPRNTPTLNEFHDYYKAVNQTAHDDNVLGKEDECLLDYSSLSTDSLNSTITVTEIVKSINKTKNSKSPSPHDYVINEYLKNTKHLMVPIFYKLFNIVLDTGLIPEAWVTGSIKPIYKNKGSAQDPRNYRPITILSCLGKLFTSILNDRINQFLDENNILSENQAGFRAKYSTTDHIFTLNFLINKLRSEKKKLFCSFIDFSAAFDSVWRTGLWTKLQKQGITGKILIVIQNMYKNIKSCVTVNGESSAMFTSFCGVRQGENLSPILFSLFLNDIEAYLSRSCNGIDINHRPDETVLYLKILILLYADDTILFGENEQSFQNNLNSFYSFCEIWKLNINYSKTKVIVFGTNKPSKYVFSINGHLLETVKEYKYLGVYFSSSGSFLQCKNHIISQANKALFQLFVRIYNLNLPVDLQIKLFDHTILPILTYGCEVWGYENLDSIEQFHCNFLRRITKTKKSTPRYMLYAELGRHPIDIIIKTRMIKYWNNLLLSKHSKISYIVYQHAIDSNLTNFKWANHIKNVLDSTGLSYIWLHQSDIVGRKIHSQVKQVLLDQFRQEWHASLNSSSKGKIYSTIKSEIKLENYLLSLPNNERLNFMHFRTGNHRFPIETGRWKQSSVPFFDRKCPLCTLNLIGDEMHYLLVCPFFRQFRSKYIPIKYTSNVSTHTFKELINTNDAQLLMNLSIFIKYLLRKFER